MKSSDNITTDSMNELQRLRALSYKNNLVAAYIDLVIDGKQINSLGEVIADINTQLGLNYSTQRLMDWRNGSRQCPKNVSNLMRQYLMQYLFGDDVAEELILLLALER